MARMRSELKQRSYNYIQRRKRRLALRKCHIEIRREVAQKKYINKVAPKNFSIIDNTKEFLAYINECRNLLHHKEKVAFNIADVDNISSDAIAVLVACTNSSSFKGEYGQILGNAPRSPSLNRLFCESGFYRFVNSSRDMRAFKTGNNSILHKESHIRVRSDIAKDVSLYGVRHVYGNEKPIPELYENLVESMSNTNNHACRNTEDKIKWWLYAYNTPNRTTEYTFIDLGVGIFDSLPVRKYKKLAIDMGLAHNVNLVDDLLAGKIKSREILDNDIRGKGIPQIAYNSKSKVFKRAFIISNDVKIDLKTNLAEKLNDDFHGTLLYWELTND